MRVMHSKRMWLDMTRKVYDHACDKKEEWYKDMGLELSMSKLASSRLTAR